MANTFILKLNCQNAAFSDGEHALEFEVARILREAASKFESGVPHSPLSDYNGNHVGSYTFNGRKR